MEQKPQTQENPKLKLIKDLQHLKIDFKDGIPEEIKHSTSKDSGWKVQKLWFVHVYTVLGDVLSTYYNDDSFSQELFNELLGYYKKLTNDNNPFKNRNTTQEDIDEAESMIDKVIVELSK